MPPHETGSTATPGAPRATAPPPRTFGPQGADPGRSQRRLPPGLPGPAVPVRQHRPRPHRPSHRVLRPRRAGRPRSPRTRSASTQLARRAAGAATGTIKPGDLGPPPHVQRSPSTGAGSTPCPASPRPPPRESPPPGLLRAPPNTSPSAPTCPPPWQDILDLAYYSGWRKQEILGLTWDEIDRAGGVIRLSPARSKTLVGRILPISPPIADALNRRRARRDPHQPARLPPRRHPRPALAHRVAHRLSGGRGADPLPPRLSPHRRAQNYLIRASVPERVAMLLTGHKSRAIFEPLQHHQRAGTA